LCVVRFRVSSTRTQKCGFPHDFRTAICRLAFAPPAHQQPFLAGANKPYAPANGSPRVLFGSDFLDISLKAHGDFSARGLGDPGRGSDPPSTYRVHGPGRFTAFMAGADQRRPLNEMIHEVAVRPGMGGLIVPVRT